MFSLKEIMKNYLRKTIESSFFALMILCAAACGNNNGHNAGVTGDHSDETECSSDIAGSEVRLPYYIELPSSLEFKGHAKNEDHGAQYLYSGADANLSVTIEDKEYYNQLLASVGASCDINGYSERLFDMLAEKSIEKLRIKPTEIDGMPAIMSVGVPKEGYYMLSAVIEGEDKYYFLFFVLNEGLEDEILGAIESFRVVKD